MNPPTGSMRAQPRWFWPAWWPIVAGVAWFALGWRDGIAAGLFASLPGALMLGPGVALLLWPGDRQISHYMALGGLAGVPLALPMMLWAGPLPGLLLIVLGAATYLTAGYAALYQGRSAGGAPQATINYRMALKVALDEALLAYFVGSARVPTGERVTADARELEAARVCVRANRWTAEPERLHTPPPAPNDDTLTVERSAGERFLHLRFTSDYTPHPDLPGGQRWLAHDANRQAHAWVLRHADGPRPWLLGIHGYRMGVPWVDFSLFQVDWLHRRLGFNMVLPILPLHGPRRVYGGRSGSGYLDGYLCDVLHAETQAVRDLRRSLAWIRRQERDPRIGVLGFSLGGYNAALLATLEPELQCVVAGIPLTDAPETVWRHMPSLHRDYLVSCGVTPALAGEVLAPVSPLNAPACVPHDRRFIVAATGDQLIPPTQPVRLIEHWGYPDTHWYQGSHLSVRRETAVNEFITDAFQRTGLIEGRAAGIGCSHAVEAGK